MHDLIKERKEEVEIMEVLIGKLEELHKNPIKI